LSDLEDPIARALGYPYAAHPEPYLFRGGRAEPLPGDVDFAALTPVVAVGSNRAPTQLARKFAEHDAAIPVTRLRARDVDVVYAAHMARYGAVPATLAPAPGVVVELWITWLDAPALRRMDESEALGVNYARQSRRLDVVEADPNPPGDAIVYEALRGCLTIAGAPVPLADIPAEGRLRQGLSQRELLAHLHATHGEGPFEDWLHAHIGEGGRERRSALTGRLAVGAMLFS
jgi:hypothetical protein